MFLLLPYVEVIHRVQGDVLANFGSDPSSSLGEERKQTDRQRDRQTDRETDRETD